MERTREDDKKREEKPQLGNRMSLTNGRSYAGPRGTGRKSKMRHGEKKFLYQEVGSKQRRPGPMDLRNPGETENGKSEGRESPKGEPLTLAKGYTLVGSAKGPTSLTIQDRY